MSELRRGVDKLSPKLEDMFQHMIANIDLRHPQEGLRLIGDLLQQRPTGAERQWSLSIRRWTSTCG